MGSFLIDLVCAISQVEVIEVALDGDQRQVPVFVTVGRVQNYLILVVKMEGQNLTLHLLLKQELLLSFAMVSVHLLLHFLTKQGQQGQDVLLHLHSL